MNGFADMDAVTRSAEDAWNADASVRHEFCSKENYLAFRRAEAKGLSRTVGRGATAFVKDSVQTSAPGQADSDWDGDADLRAEFGGHKEAYLALRRAEQAGSVKVLAPGAARPQIQQAPLQQPSNSPTGSGDFTLSQRQAQVRQENVGRQFAGLPVLPIPQE
jgi:hypothetical protein